MYSQLIQSKKNMSYDKVQMEYQLSYEVSCTKFNSVKNAKMMLYLHYLCTNGIFYHSRIYMVRVSNYTPKIIVMWVLIHTVSTCFDHWYLSFSIQVDIIDPYTIDLLSPTTLISKLQSMYSPRKSVLLPYDTELYFHSMNQSHVNINII